MVFSQNNTTMAIPPNPNQEGLDFTKVIEWFISVLGAVVLLWKAIDKYYENKKTEKEAFIANVAKLEAKTEVDANLATIKSDVTELKSDVKHLGELIMNLYTDKK